MLRYKQTVRCANAANILNIAEYRSGIFDNYMIIIIHFFHQENSNILQLLKSKVVKHTVFNLHIFSAHFKINIFYAKS